MSATPTKDLTRAEMVAIIQRFNPFGGYCVKPCSHKGHTDDAYRKTVARLRGEVTR